MTKNNTSSFVALAKNGSSPFAALAKHMISTFVVSVKNYFPFQQPVAKLSVAKFLPQVPLLPLPLPLLLLLLQPAVKRSATKILLQVLLLLSASPASAQNELYSNAYGNQKDPALIFFHGGPGYNSVSFEYSTAGKLAALGYYVIVYDQRGCGRSLEDTGAYTFNEAFSDVDNLYKKYNFKKAVVMGHSFGGTVATLFAQKFPEKVTALVMVSSPLAYQLTFRHIVDSCRMIYTASGSKQLNNINKLAAMDSTSLMYSSFSFMNAMNNGFYKAKNPAPSSKDIFDSLRKHPDAKLLSMMTDRPVMGFYTNEKYTTIDLTSALRSLKIPVYGIYGTDDGLFNNQHLQLLEAIIGKDRFTILPGASHSVFIDQQELFFEAIKRIPAKRLELPAKH